MDKALPQDLVERLIHLQADAYADGIVETAFPATPFHTTLQERADALSEATVLSDRRVVLESRARYLLADLIKKLEA